MLSWQQIMRQNWL